MKKILGLVTVLLAAGMLTGCLMRNLTEEEEARISEYAATLLLKYDANYKNLLWETVEKEEPEEEELPAAEEEEQADETVSGSAVIADDSETEPEEVSQRLAEIFGLSGIDIQYSGCEFVKSFPEEGAQGYSIQAGDGKKLLIVKLQIKNNTSEPAIVDILSGMPSFRLRFNEEEVVAQMTLIPEDFSTMEGEIPAGSAAERVLIGEVSESFSEQVEKLSIMTRFNGTTSVTSLVQ